MSLKVNKFKNNIKEQLFGNKFTSFGIFFTSKRLKNFLYENFTVREIQRGEGEKKRLLMLYQIDAYKIDDFANVESFSHTHTFFYNMYKMSKCINVLINFL